MEKLSQQFIDAVNELLISYDYRVLWSLYEFKEKLTSIVKDIKNKSATPEYVDHQYITHLFSFIDSLNEGNINDFLRYVNSDYKFEYIINGGQSIIGFYIYTEFNLILISKLDKIKEYHYQLLVEDKFKEIIDRKKYKWNMTYSGHGGFILSMVLERLSKNHYVFYLEENLLFFYSRIKIKDKKNTSKLRGKIFEWFGI